jgi:hypothetical protein
LYNASVQIMERWRPLDSEDGTPLGSTLDVFVETHSLAHFSREKLTGRLALHASRKGFLVMSVNTCLANVVGVWCDGLSCCEGLVRSMGG